MKTNKRYSQEEKLWLFENYGKIGSYECAKHLGHSVNSIRATAHALGCKITKENRNLFHSNQRVRDFKPSVNTNQFKNVEIPEVAYILGLLWADGWIVNDNYYSVDIKLKREDFDYLEWIFDRIGDWKKYKYEPIGRKPTTQLRASNKELVDYLISLDYKTKSYESASRVINTIPEKLKKYWWRGYLDGDGCIMSKAPVVQYSSGINQDWSFLNGEFKISKSITDNGKSSRATMSGLQKTYDYLSVIYDGAEIDRIFLPRKYERFLEIKEKIAN